MSNQEWRLAKYPEGMLKESDFQVADVVEPKEEDLQDGEVLVELEALSVDPYMRGRMTGVDSYMPSFKIDGPIAGFAAGTVLKSKSGLKEGTHVSGVLPFRKRLIVKAASVFPITPSEKCPITQFIGCLGMPGLTAYLSLKHIADPKEGQYAFVSGGAGAVGSTVIQLLKSKGVKVIASAGTDEKVALCKELGADAAFNYKTVGEGPELEKTLAEFAKDGLNLYYDNVGGRTLEAALNSMAQLGVIVSCGSISQYNNKERSEAFGIKNLFMVTVKSLKVEGFIVTTWASEFPAATMELAKLFIAGKLVGKQTVLEGFDKMPRAMVGLFTGDNVGKMIVKC
ncbi:putative NADP-dependent oxidoreductase YfmJ [Diplonema papillatum]|nr:putative NADP-dependent oxidoreductase YfmJ [Diplonema papillatum]